MKRLVLSIILVTFAFPSLSGDEAGFKSIFNGKDLTGWDGDPRFWSVRDGAITGQTTEDNPTEHNTFVIWRQGEVDDFILRFSYKIVGGNSGVQYRSREVDPWVIAGYQGDYEAGDTYSGINYDEKGRGILAQRGQKTRIEPDGEVKVEETFGDTKELQSHIKKEDWNEYEVIAKRNHLIHKINGQTMSEVTDDHEAELEFIGLLAFQLHAGPPMSMQIKDVRLKRLPLEDRKKLVLVAGNPSHSLGEHEFPAGIFAIKNALADVEEVLAADYYGGWPEDPTAFDNADTILFYMDGGSGHPVIQGERRKNLDALMDRGVGMVCVHYAVEVPKDKGGEEFKKWIGGYYETHYSINPHWTAEIEVNDAHPVGRGVKPFTVNDEWYFNMRFRPEMKDVTPILTATPPDDKRATDAAKAHPGREEILAWATERENGGRGFGFTGGHFHRGWGDENFRKVVLNALLWTAHGEVPDGGVQSDLTKEELNGRLRGRTAQK
jgi:type 1 glutamine amidotransferase